MPETHLSGNPFSTAPAAPPPVARPKHKPGNPFAQPELDTFPPLPGMEEPKDPFSDVSAGHSTNAPKPITGWDPMLLQRKVAEAAPEYVRGAAGGAVTMLSRVGAGIVRIGSKLTPVTPLDPNDPQMTGISDEKAMATRSKAGEELASTIRKTGLNIASKIAPPLEGPRDLSSLITGKRAPPTTTQKVARVAGEITGQLAPFVAAGPLGLAAGSGLNVAAEVGAKPEESLLGMFSKEQAQNPWKRGAAALAGDVAIAAPLHYGAQALRNYVRAKTAVSPEELARMGEAIPGAQPAPERPALPPSAPPAAVSRVGAIGNQPKPALPLKEGPRGPVVDLANYPLAASPAGRAREAPRLRYERTTKGGRGALTDRSWMDATPIVDESQLSDKVLSGQQRRLLDVAHEAADASPSGGIVVDPGHKTAESVGKKIARKEAGGERPDLSPLAQIGDVNRASIVVDHPNDAGPVIRHLQDQGWVREVDDKFHKPDALGYGAVHLQLVDPITEQAAELQIHTPQTWAARDTFGGHDIYDYLFSKEARPILTASDQTEARRLIEYNRNLYSEAHDAAMRGKPLAGQDGAYQIRMELDRESPAYGRWYVEERPPAGSPAGAHGPKVAETDNPFKARTMMNELDKTGAHVSTAPASSEIPASTAETAATTAPEGVVSTPQSAQSARTADVPRGNYPQSNVDNPPLNPFREQHPPAESQLQGPIGHEDVTYFGNRAVRTRYRVIDAGSAVASNDPHTFARRADYPAAIQGRVYHGSAGRGAQSKAKVTDALRQWSEAADKAKASDGSADMFGVSAEKPDEAFARIFGGEPLAGATAERNIGARATPMVGGNRRGFVGTPPHILSSLAGDASKDPYNYAAFKMLSSMAGAGVGGAGGGYAGSKLPADSPEERRRNTAVGVGLGAFAGFMAPFTPEMVEDFAKMLRRAGAEVPAKRFSLNVSPELVRVKIEGHPSQTQMKQLFTAVQKNPKAQFRWSLRDKAGNEVGSGKYLHELAAEMPWADSNAPRSGATHGDQLYFGPPKAGAVGNQPEHIVQSAVQTADGKHFSGDWHSDALEKLDASLSLDQLNSEGIEGLRAGFETSTGRFVSREEAFQIARDAGQEPKYVSSNAAGKPELWSGTYWPKNKAGAGNRIGAVGNQPEPRPGPRPPTRKVRSPYEEQDIVYWPRNSRAAIEKAKSTLNLSTAGLDKTATARLRTLIASGLDKGTIDKGYRSFEEMDLSTLQRKRELLKELVEDPNTLIGGDKLQQIPTDDIKAMWMIAHDNTKTIEAAARVMNDPLASEAERLSAAELHDKAYKQTEELLSRIVTGTAQKGRELGALRNIAKQSTDPEVWLVQAKKMMGDRPLPDAVQANIRQLARRAQEACL